MTDMICRKTMMRCQTPGMCSPFGGCRDDSVSWYARMQEERAADKARIAELESVLSHARAVLPAEKWADDAKRMIDATLAKLGGES